MQALGAREGSFDHGWPHSYLKPLVLAEAGFHFTPTEPGDDTATCYACDKSLGGWEAGDDPLSEHFTHSSACPWATLMMQQRKKTLLPQGPEMQAAREASFVGWPYEKKRGWTIKARKMAQAGWHYAPSAESQDAVACIYCLTELDGWEPKDDPLKEHEKRARDLSCAFFVGLSPSARDAKSTLASEQPAKRTKAQTIRGARAGSVPTTISDATEASASTNAMTEKRTKGKAGGKRKLLKSTKKLDLEAASDAMATMDDEAVNVAAKAAVPIILQSARKKRKSDVLLLPTDRDEQDDQDAPDSPSTKKQRTGAAPVRRSRRSESVSSVSRFVEALLSPEPEPVPPASLRKKRATATKLRDQAMPLLEIDEVEVPEALRPVEEPSRMAAKKTAARPKRATKKNSLQESAIVQEQAPLREQQSLTAEPQMIARRRSTRRSSVASRFAPSSASIKPEIADEEVLPDVREASTQRQPVQAISRRQSRSSTRLSLASEPVMAIPQACRPSKQSSSSQDRSSTRRGSGAAMGSIHLEEIVSSARFGGYSSQPMSQPSLLEEDEEEDESASSHAALPRSRRASSTKSARQRGSRLLTSMSMQEESDIESGNSSFASACSSLSTQKKLLNVTNKQADRTSTIKKARVKSRKAPAKRPSRGVSQQAQVIIELVSDDEELPASAVPSVQKVAAVAAPKRRASRARSSVAQSIVNDGPTFEDETPALGELLVEESATEAVIAQPIAAANLVSKAKTRRKHKDSTASQTSQPTASAPEVEKMPLIVTEDAILVVSSEVSEQKGDPLQSEPSISAVSEAVMSQPEQAQSSEAPQSMRATAVQIRRSNPISSITAAIVHGTPEPIVAPSKPVVKRRKGRVVQSLSGDTSSLPDEQFQLLQSAPVIKVKSGPGVTKSTPVVRRTSSRRGSNQTGGGALEEIVGAIMLDSRGNVRPQRTRKKASPVEAVVQRQLVEDLVEENNQLTSVVAEPILEDVEESSAVPESPKVAANTVPEITEMTSIVEDTIEEAQERAVDSNALTLATPLQSPIKSSKWEDFPRDLYDAALLRPEQISRLEDLTQAELSMTVEDWIRHIARREVDKLTGSCEGLISKLLEGGERARHAIQAMQ